MTAVLFLFVSVGGKFISLMRRKSAWAEAIL